MIKSVFREFPYVERMYNACVPVKCSEKAFRTAFVQSEYFYKISHRGGQEVRTESTESTDIFNDYPNESKVDVFLSPTVVRPRVLGPLDTLARDAEPVVAGAVPEFVTAVPSARKTAVDTIMRKYNRHSATILGAAAAVQRTLRPAAAAPGAAPGATSCTRSAVRLQSIPIVGRSPESKPPPQNCRSSDDLPTRGSPTSVISTFRTCPGSFHDIQSLTHSATMH